MHAIRLTHTLDSETLYLPQLRPLLGQRVEIIVLSQDEAATIAGPAAPSVNSLLGSVLRYDDPFGPAVPAVTLGTGDWTAWQASLGDLQGYDFDALKTQREYDLKHANDHLP